jgi:hypothetical protein
VPELVKADVRSGGIRSRPLLFALAFVGYFAETSNSHYVPLGDKHAKPLCRLLRPGSLLRRTTGGDIGFWHPWLARIVLEQLAYSDSWLHVLDEGLIATLRQLDTVSPLCSRALLLELPISRPFEESGFSKLVTCYREAVGPNGSLDDHFPDVSHLAAFLGPGASEDAKNEFMASVHVVQSRRHRLHFCPDYGSAVRHAEDAVKLCRSFENRHNLAKAKIELEDWRRGGIRDLLTRRQEIAAEVED